MEEWTDERSFWVRKMLRELGMIIHLRFLRYEERIVPVRASALIACDSTCLSYFVPRGISGDCNKISAEV